MLEQQSSYVDYDFNLVPNEKRTKRLKLVDSIKQKSTRCNLCGKRFKPKTKFERFCLECKIENEDYHAYEDDNRIW